MATTASPYGLIPVKRVDGMPYAGATETFLIDPAGEATNIFNGQVVIIGADGYLAISTATGADITTNNLGGSGVGAIGVFVGCEYVNAQGQVINAQYYPAGTTGVVTAKVVTDSNVVFQAQLDGSGAQTVLGNNTFFAAVQSTSTGSIRTGNSTSALDATVQTAAAAFRIVGFASTPGDTYTDVLVKFNPSAHSYLNAVGL
tara:strand:+ start:2371 stop:2973 length:603 start_codon:yes stop_codon:yes gene_type:complete